VEEDEQLKNLVATYGTGNCKLLIEHQANALKPRLLILYISLLNLGTLIAQSLPERTGKQCRERWHNHLGSGIKKGDWTEEVTTISAV